jgi:signal transduction histidine kinase/CheY-like chemotaxis protein
MATAQARAQWEGVELPRLDIPSPSDTAIDYLAHGSLWRRLVLLIVVAIGPLLAFGVYHFAQDYERERSAAETALVQRAETLAATVDQQVDAVISGIRIMAKLPTTQDDVVGRFRMRLAVASGERPSFTVLSIEPDLLSAIPDLDLPPGRAGMPTIASPLIGNDLRSPVITITIPVVLQRGIRVTVTVALDEDRMQAILQLTQVSDGWITAILDGNYRVVTRNLRPKDFIGTESIRPVRDALAARASGFIHAQDLEGVESSIAFARAPMTGFAAAIAMPSAVFDGPQRSAMVQTALYGLAVSLAATIIATLCARQVRASLRRVVRDVISGVEPSVGFSEIADLARTLQAAVRQRDDTRAELMQRHGELRQILDALPLSVFVSDDRGIAIFANERILADYGGAPMAAPGDRDKLFHPHDLPRLRVWRQMCLRPDQLPPDPIELRYKVGGEYRWHLLRKFGVQPLRDGSRCYISVGSDIHDQREAREVLIRSNALLETRVAERTRDLLETAAKLQQELRRVQQMMAALAHAQKREALARLTGGVAHDINNVLAVIGNSYTAIDMTPTDASKVRDAVDMGRAAVAHAASLIRNLTTFSRQQPLSTSAIDTRTALLEIAPLCRNALGEASTLALDVDEALWAIGIDRGMLEAALINLVTNARDATPGGGRAVIAAHNVVADASVVISVSDTGCGMSADTAIRAIEPFFTTKVDTRGTGLGLAMVDGFVTQSGGALEITSAVGEGTTVTMRFPRLAPADAAPDRPARPQATLPPALEPGGKRTILVVDDNLPLLRSTALLLRTYGYAVLEASGPRRAFDLAADHPEIDAVLTDVVMPDGGGAALAERLAGLRPDLPIIFITGFADDAQATGGRLVVRKPVDSERLRNTLEAAMRARAASA